MKKVKLIILGNTMLLLMCFVLTAFLNYFEFQEDLSNGFMSNNSITVYLNSLDERDLQWLDSQLDRNKELIVYAQGESIDGYSVNYIRNVSVKNEYMQLGSCFTEEDYRNGALKAIVGDNVLNSNFCSKTKSGTYTLSYYDKTYEITGVFSRISEVLNNAIYIIYEPKDCRSLHEITIGSSDKSLVSRTIQTIVSNNLGREIVLEKNYLATVIFSESGIYGALAIGIVFIIALMIYLLYQFKTCYDLEIYIKYIFGYSFSKIVTPILAKLSIAMAFQVLGCFVTISILYVFIDVKWLSMLEIFFYILSYYIISITYMLISIRYKMRCKS